MRHERARRPVRSAGEFSVYTAPYLSAITICTSSATSWSASRAQDGNFVHHKEGEFHGSPSRICCSYWIEDPSCDLADLQPPLGVFRLACYPRDGIRQPPHRVASRHVDGELCFLHRSRRSDERGDGFSFSPSAEYRRVLQCVHARSSLFFTSCFVLWVETPVVTSDCKESRFPGMEV